VSEVATYELLEDEGQALRIRKTSVQSANAQTVNLPDGSRAKLIRMTGSGSGEVIMNLGAYLPESMEMTVETSTKVEPEPRGSESQELLFGAKIRGRSVILGREPPNPALQSDGASPRR
jgi:hypothetical protein